MRSEIDKFVQELRGEYDYQPVEIPHITKKDLYEKSGLELKKFFNTSGQRYRELGLKDKLASMSESEMLEVLASDGMLIKRPITTDGQKVTLGFKEEQFEKTWS